MRSAGWYRSDEPQPSFGFKVSNTILAEPKGGIVFAQCSVEDSLYGFWLGQATNARPTQRCSLLACAFRGYWIQEQPVEGSRGVYIENALGTLVLGGAIAQCEYGIYIGPSSGGNPATGRSQIIGLKFDDLSQSGVYISAEVAETQVVAAARAGGGHVVDNGADSLVLSPPASQFPVSVDILGLLNASQPNPPAPAGTVTRYGTGEGYSDYLLDQAFGANLPDGFTGIYLNSATTPPAYYLVTRAGGQWRRAALIRP